MKKIWLFLFLVICATNVQAAAPVVYPIFHVDDDDGNPCANCCTYWYDCGTSIKHATCADATCSANNANPLELNARGEADVYVSWCAKVAIYTADDDGTCDSTPTTTLVEDRDIVYGIGGTDTISLSTTYGGDISAALADIGATPTTLICDSTVTWPDAETDTTPETLTLEVRQGCMVQGTAGGGTETLAFGKPPVVNGNFQWVGANLVVTGLSYAEPEWWGDNTTPGTTDMTAEIQAADDALTVEGTLQFNAGVYLFSSSLTPAGLHTWQGLGSGVTELKSSYSGNNIVLMNAVRIKSLTLNGVSKVAGSVGIYGAAKHNIELYQVEIKNFETGINTTGGIFWNVTLCNVHDNVDGLKAVTTGTGFNDNEFVSNKFVGNTGKGVWLEYSASEITSNTFIGNNVEDNGFGFYLLGVYNTTIVGGFMEGQTTDHIYADDSGAIYTTGLHLNGIRMNTMDPGEGVHIGGNTNDVSGINLFLKDHDWVNTSTRAIHLSNFEEVGSGMVYSGKIIRRTSTSTWAENVAISDGNVAFRRSSYEDGEWHERYAQVATTDATPTVLASLSLTDEKVYLIEAQILAQKSDGSERSSYHIEGLFYRDGGGNATQEGATTVISSIEGDAAMACDFGVLSTTARIIVTGLAGTGFTWTVLNYEVRIL